MKPAGKIHHTPMTGNAKPPPGKRGIKAVGRPEPGV